MDLYNSPVISSPSARFGSSGRRVWMARPGSFPTGCHPRSGFPGPHKWNHDDHRTSTKLVEGETGEGEGGTLIR